MSQYVIETKGLTKQYGSQKSVSDLNLHVQQGRIYGLLGRNGAGKTTTMKMLLGLVQPTAGSVSIWGKPLRQNERKLLPRIGSLIESPGFYPNLTATENLRIFAALRGVPSRNAIQNALELVGLPEGRGELPEGEEFFVTPREVDQRVADMGKTLGYAVSMALNPSLSVEDLTMLLE